jgi:D-amino-acid dehydrogenase
VRALVLGAGVVGTTTAYWLARLGHEVTVLDRREGPGLETSFANGALLTPSTSDSWAAPGMPRKILGWLGREDAPFLVRARALPGLWRWGALYLQACTEARWRANTGATFALARFSLAAYRELCAAEPLAFDRNPPGLLKLFRDELSMRSALKAASLYRELGLEFEVLDAAGCVRAEPALARIAGKVSGAILYPGDESGDAYGFTTALAARCADLGVTFRHGVAVEALVSEGGRVTGAHTSSGPVGADAVVLALGPHSPRVARSVGLDLPIYPAKGYSVTVEVDGWNARPRLAIADDGRKAAVVPLGSHIRVAGTVELAGYDDCPNEARGRMLLDTLADILPECPQGGAVRHWAGLRPLTPDGRPLLGASPRPGLFLNTGHGPLGWTLACGSARALAELIHCGKPSLDLEPFGWPRPTRASMRAVG